MSATLNTSRASRESHAADRLDSADRVGVILLWANVVVAVVVAALALINALNWSGQPFLGALTTRSLVVDSTLPADSAIWSTLSAGLQTGDRLISLNGVPLATGEGRPALNDLLKALAVGDQVVVEFDRPVLSGAVRINSAEDCADPVDGLARCTLTAALGTFPGADFAMLFFVPYLSGVIALFVGTALLMLRGRALEVRLGASVILMFSVLGTAFFDLNTSQQLTRLWIMGGTLMGTVLLALAMVFPIPMPITRRAPWVRYLPVLVGALMAVALILLHERASSPEQVFLALWLAPGTALLGVLLLLLSMLRRRSQAASQLVRDQVNSLLIGAALGLVIGLVWLANTVLSLTAEMTLLPLNAQLVMPLLLVPVLSVAYAVTRRRVTNTDRAISQSITYTLLLIVLITGYGLLVLAASLLAREAVAPDNPLVIAVAVFFIAVLFAPVRTRLQARIDRIYFRQRANYAAALEGFSRELGSLGDVEAVVPVLRAELDRTLQSNQIFIFLRDPTAGGYCAEGTDIIFAETTPLLNILRRAAVISLVAGQAWDRDVVAERARLSVLNAQVIAGLLGSGGALNGFILLAPPRTSDGVYNYEALRYLETLAAQVSVAFERAQVVDSLEQRVRELDVFSQLSQGVNFTLDMDDQLELIYAQANRLIGASHFYITMFDRDLNEMYHVFFVENSDRHVENENRRWRLGNDLFSEVVRTGQPINIENYADALANAGVVSVVEDRAMRAWVGVPLIATTDTIGVLSAGTTDPMRGFSVEQVKMLRDIGLLAATSLDKSRLFNETNERARQLGVLNTIAGEIVAAEKDLDRLLNLITESSTEILSAEAGSLLLMTDDETGDLEFKVVVGGGGRGLIGVRVPAGRGLVGEVASKARPVIVNDASRDPRWGGEFAKGAFRTNSVLAVPLTTQNRVIGVLEVLNKTRAGGFSAGDAQLLTAFANQAAVAIENARLFQLTDFQLSMRVNELETLERIDVELNRSLDLQRVAEITVRSAMETAGAAAALLGLVTGDPPYLQVIYQQGYEDADKPEGSEDWRFPLDRGIVARVYRSKQPELVYDVSMDPNYVPSLRGAISQTTLPMLSAGAVMALLVLETNREPRLRLADLPFLQRLAEHASIAIANAQLYDEVERANASKSEFVSFVAHELKNPLTSIQGYSDFLIKGAVGALSDPQVNFVRTIQSNAVRMNTLVSDLNDVTKLQTNNMRMAFAPVAFTGVVEETLRPLQRMIEEKGQVVVQAIQEDLPLLYADEGRLIQVLTNLVSNAHKYSPPDSEIRLAAWLDDTLRDARGRRLDPQVHIAVTDQGIGMSPEDVRRLFTPYFRSDNPLAREQPGTGLGLTITRGIVDAHGGMIWVESALGEGTTFHFSCPAALTAEAGD
ncbi:MAG: GAF domain-containing protein [Anaerolineae bacterium]|nr:GAF domain-containing protein [Anaerolineae bacterium]NUQ04653.1 GAF domain-containing protein [Anaerolineae bacterium]